MSREKEEQKGIDWAAAERAAIEEEDAPTEGAWKPRDELEDATGLPPASEGPATPVPDEPVAGGVVVRNPHAQQVQKFGDILRKALPQFQTVIPKGVDPGRLIGVALTALERTPGLLECTGISVLRGILI